MDNWAAVSRPKNSLLGKADSDMIPISTTTTDGNATVLYSDRRSGEWSSYAQSGSDGLRSMKSSCPTLTPGVYRHFKGRLYEVVGVAPLVDSNDAFVVYRPLYGDQKLVIRSFNEFVEWVERDGRKQPRFQLCQESREPHRSVVGRLRERFVHVVRSKCLGRILRKPIRPTPQDQEQGHCGAPQV